MWTPGPAAGSAFAFVEFLHRALNSLTACRCLLGRRDPAYPFIARERRQILPRSLRLCLRVDGFAQIHRDSMDGAGFVFSFHDRNGEQCVRR